MNYADRINSLLVPRQSEGPLVVDLFAGCGGLALGLEAQGFSTHGFEMVKDYAESYRRNLTGPCECVELKEDTKLPAAPIVIGGPPCQPFSVGGHQNGLRDARDGFPAFLSAVRRLKPELFMFENVRGMLYGNKWYLEEITVALEDLGYVVERRLLNAVDYGVPQNRERVICVGHRGGFRWPEPEQQRVTAGEALAHWMEEIPPDSKFLTDSMDDYVARYEKASFCVNPRDLHPHKPARTLTCRNLAGATGDMHRIRLPDGRRRRLLIREAARLQSFPDTFEFCGGETARFNQVGNAVAPLFAWHLAGAIRHYLTSSERLSPKQIAALRRHNQMELLPI